MIPHMKQTSMRFDARLASISLPAPRAGLLDFVSSEEVADMGRAIASGVLPIEFAAKLDRLSSKSLLHQFIAESSHDFIRLLMAAQFGEFGPMPAGVRERLLRVLAYVRKENDAVPDFKPGGFEDDLREVRAATSELGGLLQRFKEWHLRHAVPAMWPA